MPTELKTAASDVTKRAVTLIDEFKAFALKGNVIDLATGVIIGAAFGKIVDSLVKNIILPLLGALLPGDGGYLGWKFSLGGNEIHYGLFIGECINFLIVALALFIFLKKFLGWVIREKQEDPPLSKDQELLTEIRDLLKRQTANDPPPPV
jgi:large conductance mechanosensitive channel